MEITIRTEVDAPAETAWQVYTSAEHIVHWNFASEDWCCPRADIDLTPGGSYCARMEAKDGSFGFDFEATYDEITPPSLIAMTLGDGRRVRTTFRAKEGGTLVETVFDAEPNQPTDMQQEGWQAILDNFKSRVESVV